MISTLFALCVSATPPSPASFSAMSFYDEAFVQSREDEKLGDWGWPTLEFPSRGVVVTKDGEVERDGRGRRRHSDKTEAPRTNCLSENRPASPSVLQPSAFPTATNWDTRAG